MWVEITSSSHTGGFGMSKTLCWGDDDADKCSWNKAWMELYYKCMEIMTLEQKELIWEMMNGDEE